ncbi:MAG: hypothetical protein AAGH19_11290, partial [Pseudomonadota bacterium]
MATTHTKPGVILVTAAVLTSSVSQAASITEGRLGGHTLPGIVVEIGLVPEKPTPGEPFTVRISGTAYEFCPLQEYSFTGAIGSDHLFVNAKYEVCEQVAGGAFECSVSCELEDLPLEFSDDVLVPASVWNEIEQSRDLKVSLGVVTDPDPLGTDRGASWERTFDLVRGTHAIPPRLGSGYWVREDLPNVGLLIQQEGNVIVAYDMDYGSELTNAGNHVATWTYASAEFSGNTTNGLAISVAKPDLDQNDVVFEEVLSSSIIVDGVNHIRAMFD